MEKTDAQTKIVFSDPEEMERRRNHIKAFKNVKERPFLVDDHSEKIRNLCELMILEGFSDEEIDELLALSQDPMEAQTLDFLHMAGLVMGFDFVREKLKGKELALDQACAFIRENYHEEQMKPCRDIYENLDEKISAALAGEDTLTRQIAILKLQTEHVKELYDVRLENAKIQADSEKVIALQKAETEKKLLEEKNKALQKELDELKTRQKSRDKEYALFLSKALSLRERDQERKKQKHGSFFWGREVNKTKDSSGSAALQKEGEKNDRREFCLEVLGNGNFSPEQIELVLPCLMDEKVPLSTLKILCRPDLPAKNMSGFIRFIKGGQQEDAKQ